MAMNFELFYTQVLFFAGNGCIRGIYGILLNRSSSGS